MKKIRYVPYGYTVRNGAMVVASDEAKIVKEIFDQYIDGASLKDKGGRYPSCLRTKEKRSYKT